MQRCLDSLRVVWSALRKCFRDHKSFRGGKLDESEFTDALPLLEPRRLGNYSRTFLQLCNMPKVSTIGIFLTMSNGSEHSPLEAMERELGTICLDIKNHRTYLAATVYIAFFRLLDFFPHSIIMVRLYPTSRNSSLSKASLAPPSFKTLPLPLFPLRLNNTSSQPSITADAWDQDKSEPFFMAEACCRMISLRSSIFRLHLAYP